MAENSTKTWLNPFLKPLRQTINEVVAMSAFINILALAVPIFTLQVYDQVVGHNGFSTLQGLVVGMIIIVVFDFILRQARSRILQNLALRIDVYVSQKLFNKFVSLPMQTLENKPSAYWLSLFSDADNIRDTLSGKSATLVADLPFAILFFIVILVIATPVAWVLLMALSIFMFCAWRSSAVIAAVNRAEHKTAQTRASLVSEIVNARGTIKALSLETVMGPMWEEVQAKNIEASVVQSTKTDNFSNMSASLIMALFVCVTTVGALAIIGQQLTVGTLVATSMLSSLLLGPLNQCVGSWRTYYSFRQSVDRLGALFNLISERQKSQVSMDEPRGEITMENISFAYSPELPKVINDIGVTFKARGVHALVGPNGSGKSTMLNLVQGLYKPMNGRILIDGADISQFSRRELSTWMGFVPQNCTLFKGTIRDNIACRQVDFSDDEVLRAAQASGAHQFIVDLPDGYSTEIGEAGHRLSCGQRQCIAIARALVGDPPVVLLDEPSSDLDRQAKLNLSKTLTYIGKKRNVIVATHSSILLGGCDDLVALDKGHIHLAGLTKDTLPKLFGNGAELAHVRYSEPLSLEGQQRNKIGDAEDSLQVQTQTRNQTKGSQQVNKLIAVRANKAPTIKVNPNLESSVKVQREEQPKSKKKSINIPALPENKGGKL
jgi:ATP-binding cassette subfamily C protein LapB